MQEHMVSFTPKEILESAKKMKDDEDYFVIESSRR
jgi:hypothetical protein